MDEIQGHADWNTIEKDGDLLQQLLVVKEMPSNTYHLKCHDSYQEDYTQRICIL
jgi:hypothetical protein